MRRTAPVAPATTTVHVASESSILNGPDFFSFVQAALVGSDSPKVTFTLPTTGRVRGSLATTVPVEVTLTRVRPEDGSGMLFIFEGTTRGKAVTGFYNAKVDSTGYQTGHIKFV